MKSQLFHPQDECNPDTRTLISQLNTFFRHFVHRLAKCAQTHTHMIIEIKSRLVEPGRVLTM